MSEPASMQQQVPLGSEIRDLRVTMARIEERIMAMQKATDKSDSMLEAYKNASNEWRGALSDSYKNMISRQEYEAKHETLVQSVDALKSRLFELEGRKLGSGELVARMISWIGILVALAVGMAALVVHH